MQRAAIFFIVSAVIVGVIGFSGLAGSAGGLAKLLFGALLIISLLSLAFSRRPAV